MIGPAFESQAALKWLNENGYWPVRSGPYQDANMFPCVDVDRFLIVAERQIEPMIPAAAVRDALAELRTEMASMAVNLPADYWIKKLDATMTALGLGAEGEKQ